MQHIFVTGISTDVGKTIASAIITEALEADYWKPIQSGSTEISDCEEVMKMISNKKTKIHQPSYTLKAPLSPHAAAELEGITIEYSKIIEPKTENHLVIEGAGGLLVPLNDTDTILDIIMPTQKVVVVSRNYLGSINHTLLTVNWLNAKGYDTFILFSGEENEASERIIAQKTEVPILGRIDEEEVFDKATIKKYAERLRPALLAL